ncbi:MAG TPA: hypothetical protein VKC90_06445, partial [Chitinophagaceae bacterium]|nr:hypothetical protein [Chitinophagaceae bacterium]
MRDAMALNLLSIKVFGFLADEPEEQGLQMPGSANVAFSWNSTDTMYIEYNIPLSFLGKESLNQKEISIGWKLNGIQRKSTNEGASTTADAGQGNGRSGRGGGRSNFGGGGRFGNG